MGFVYAPRGAHSLQWTALRTQPSSPSYAPPSCSRWAGVRAVPATDEILSPGKSAARRTRRTRVRAPGTLGALTTMFSLSVVYCALPR